MATHRHFVYRTASFHGFGREDRSVVHKFLKPSGDDAGIWPEGAFATELRISMLSHRAPGEENASGSSCSSKFRLQATPVSGSRYIYTHPQVQRALGDMVREFGLTIEHRQ